MSVTRYVLHRYPELNTIGKIFQKAVSGPKLGAIAASAQSEERVTRMRDDFLDAASHELKTPLTSLRLKVQLISRIAETPAQQQLSTEKLKLLAEDADRQITRMTNVINSLLDASGMRVGKLQLTPQEFDLAELVREEVALFNADPAFAHLDIRVHAPQPTVGNWDRVRISQVIKSLLSNAAQYGRKQPIDVTVWADRARARVSVRDRGIGIAEEDQERIFRQFERSVPGEKFNGLGLGLFISRQVALAHKGSIAVESKLDEGSVFTLKLPYRSNRSLRVVKTVATA